jgi:hypothetical protein
MDNKITPSTDPFNTPEFRDALDDIIAVRTTAEPAVLELIELLNHPTDKESPQLEPFGEASITVKRVYDESDPGAYDLHVTWRQKLISKSERIKVEIHKVPLSLDEESLTTPV